MDAPETTDLAVRVTRRIACPASRLWEAFTRASCLEAMHPFVARHETPDLPLREGATDSVVYHSGRRLERRYVEWVEGHHVGLDVTIHGLPGEPVGHARVASDVEDEGGTCSLTVTISLADVDPATRAIREQMIRQYLDQMLQGFAFHCETGEPVRPNQFGTHPFYS